MIYLNCWQYVNEIQNSEAKEKLDWKLDAGKKMAKSTSGKTNKYKFLAITTTIFRTASRTTKVPNIYIAK